jgi:hypothetical protein
MAKNDQEEAFEKILAANLQRTLDFLKYAETKNGALLTVASAWALAILALLTREKPLPDNLRSLFLISLPFIIATVLVAIWSFAPRTGLSRFLGGKRAGPHAPNLLYFGELSALTVAVVERDLRERYYPRDEHVTTDGYIHDLSVQLGVNSQIVRRKLRFFSVGLVLMALAILVPLGRLGLQCYRAGAPWH